VHQAWDAWRGKVWCVCVGFCMDLEANVCVSVVGLYSLLSMTMSGPSPVKGYVRPGNGDVNPVIGNITTA